MRGTWGICSLLLLTMAAASRGRNAAAYFQEAQFQHSPPRPEDALVLFIRNAPPIICELDTSGECYGVNHAKDAFCLDLPHGFSHYICFFEGNGTKDSNIELINDILPVSYNIDNDIRVRVFGRQRMYCTNDSQLPEEYFHMRVQRPHEDHPIKCHFLNERDTLQLRFPGYPTITCSISNEDGRYQFTLPGIDDPFTCAFGVYSELPLGVTRTEQRLYQSLISGLPARVDGARPRLDCFRHGDSNATAHFQLQLQTGERYDCHFPDTSARCPAQS